MQDICQLLLSLGLISGDQLEIARIEQTRTNKKLETLFVELGFISDKALKAVRAEQLGLGHFDLQHTALDSQLIDRTPKELLLKYKVLPLSMDDNILKLAMDNVYDILAMDHILRFFPGSIQIAPVVATEADIIEAIDTYYGQEVALDALLLEIEKQKVSKTDKPDNTTVRLVNAIVSDAIKQRASDIHFQPESLFVRLRYRIDGELTQVSAFHRDYWPGICVRLKIMAGMNIAESRQPQDGRFTFQINTRKIDLRASSHPTTHGENIVLRILDRANALLPLNRIGFSDTCIQVINKMLTRPQGIIIVTGPTGSGKTTTLYSMLNHINTAAVNIMTLEQPIEYQLPMIRQLEINEMTGTSFADGVRSILRQDPDIIFIGEIRDEETAKMALRAAMTGHLVLTTLHTNDSFGTIPRLAELGIDTTMLAGQLLGVISQRLVRKAHSKGRTSIAEVLEFTPALNELLTAQASLDEIRAMAISQGFKSIYQDGQEKVIAGQTSISELQSACAQASVSHESFGLTSKQL